MEKNKVKICFPNVGNYYPAFKTLLDLFECEIVKTPPYSRKTVEIGAKYSPESICFPYKYFLGNYIEALELGANVIVEIGGGCRLGYYSEAHTETLKSLGYKFKVLDFNNLSSSSVIGQLKKLNPKLTHYRFFRGFLLAYRKARVIEQLEEFIRLNIGFEETKGELEKILKLCLKEMENMKSISKLQILKLKYIRKLKAVPIKKPANRIRVGVIGDLYTQMEPFANFDIEKKLGEKGVEVYRFVKITGLFNELFTKSFIAKKWIRNAKPYLKYHIGARSTDSVAVALELAKEGFDGLIHIKPSGCMPEINAMAALHRISQEHKIPIVYFSFDTQTSETGINTRLEAFHDMLVMKRKKNGKN